MAAAIFYSKKKTVTGPEADNGFYFDLNDTVRPLSTLLLAAEDNYSADEYDNKANKVANGDNFIHGHPLTLGLCYCVAGRKNIVKHF
ncbi:MAG: hypothetical protein PVI71_11555 [Desulfobacterales bacterium]